ncbi:MAG: AMP-binding protein [Opitutales bacterium]|nr:AMP-binding protein [Opitutales bacterium]MCH8539931.1 AMP-binding protein [Opitutales bacterium]
MPSKSISNDPHWHSEHLGRALLKSLKCGWDIQVVDRTEERKVLRKPMVLGAALALAMRWKFSDLFGDRRIGLVLPPGAGATVANLALVFLNKIPVNLNFTQGREATEHSLKIAGVTTVVSAALMKKKVDDFPWPENFVDIRRELQAIGKAKILGWALRGKVTSVDGLADLLGLPGEGGNAEAGLLFTSGSSGLPKGVPLTHANLLGNASQITATRLLLKDRHVLLANLPVFHSFGFMVTLWYCLLAGVRYVTVPSPLETKKSIEAIREEKCTVLMSTPTFLRPYLKKADKADLQSLKFVICGAEKLSPGLRRKFEETFGVPLMEGYGLSETSPVVSVNLPDEYGTPEDGPMNRKGTVGKPLTGVQVKIRNFEDGEVLKANEEGRICIWGANVFPGYLDMEEKNKELFDDDGWLLTSDRGKLDEDGFLMISGRVSRFSKIGGEMVSHAAVENAIEKAMGWEDEEEAVIAILPEEDERKGETLVLLTSRPIEDESLRKKLREAGAPNLFIPSRIVETDKIPTLASGKLDLRRCREEIGQSGKRSE